MQGHGISQNTYFFAAGNPADHMCESAYLRDTARHMRGGACLYKFSISSSVSKNAGIKFSIK